MNSTPEAKCPHCGYGWSPRVPVPKRCPMCQRWLSPWDEAQKHAQEKAKTRGGK